MLFRSLLREAHRRGLRIITELVLNHTSAEHPWFQRARRAPDPGLAPSADAGDGRVHFTPANMFSHFHRAIEADTTARVLKAIFAERGWRDGVGFVSEDRKDFKHDLLSYQGMAPDAKQRAEMYAGVTAGKTREEIAFMILGHNAPKPDADPLDAMLAAWRAA